MDRELPLPRRVGLALLALVGLVPMACGATSPSVVVAIPTASTAPTATPAFKVLSSDGSEFGFITDVNTVTANYTTLPEYAEGLQDPTQLLQVSHFWGATTLGQPVSGVTHDHPLGVRYVNGQWAIVNEDQAPMPAGVRFFVKTTTPGSDRWGHFSISQTATAANTQSFYTVIDDPHTNGLGNVRLFVTQNVTAGGSGGGVYNNHPIGVFYIGGKWAIFNEDQAPMPLGAAFNVMVDLGGTTATFVHGATAANTTSYATAVPEAGDAQVGGLWWPIFLTQFWVAGKPSAIGGPGQGVYNPHNTGVFVTTQQTWSIFNEDHAAMPIGATFNIGIL